MLEATVLTTGALWLEQLLVHYLKANGVFAKMNVMQYVNKFGSQGCPLGEMSKQLIPVGAWAQIPRAEHQGCYRICQCSNHGSLEKCRDLNCPAATTCWVQNSFVAHRTSFYLECKPCRCFEGEVTCSRKSCAEVRYSTLPCDCPSHYVPVCGRLGVTYASACLAKCAGLLVGELEYNSCSKRRGHVCGTSKASDPGSCKPNETCFARPKVCLSPIHKPCEQHECIRLPCDPRSDKRGPVCDKKSHEHPSLCSLAQRGAQLAYWGHCQQRCSTRGKVCGINGEEYDSECAAWADRTVVDYQGECIAVGLIGEQPKPRCADAVACPPLARQNCIGVTPPGACCPVCGGAARLFYSKKQLDRIYYQLPDDSDKRIVTLEAMLDGLSRQLKVAECVLRGKITLDGDIFVLNQPVSKRPSELQLSACVAEIEKLVSRIADRSPKIVAEVPLSSLTWAEVVHSRVASNGAMTAQRNVFTLVGLAALVVRITF
ncbi:reversion-inducing cysteine-rich protein with Kazal motifs-like [Copidosoma floridanum]|uniref:reversion-inducing cysteine-rich protein with Kazal motifs-like n=1 Tax=Copidosoma floridanum TaxID=29053 RepID=UPI0006C9461B|nr:reversion-inducing cysteine-rich protein with Kazal motifs-like [Copidosoma floridanum]